MFSTVQVLIPGMEIAAQSYSDHHDLKSNTPPLISRLHPEILQIVFIHCACDHFTTYPEYLETGVAPSWVNVSHVCRYWRDVALACPALWSYLFIASPRWTEELLVRSKQAPLKVQVNILFTQIDQALPFWGQVMNHLERIQELNLDIHDGRWEIEFYPILCARASRLQHLRIVIFAMDTNTRRLPVLFEGDTPALCTLELSRCSVPWYSFRLSGLTTLGLYNIHGPDQKSVAEFLAMLRSMQCLENLYLSDALPRNADFHSSATLHALLVDLPHLSRLLIIAPLSAVVAFLAGVNLPPKTKRRLDCRCEEDNSIHACAQLFSILGNQQAKSTPTWRSLIIEHVAPSGRLAFTFSTLEHGVDPLCPWLPLWTSPTLFIIRLQLGWLTPLVLGALLSLVPLPAVHMLHVFLPPYAPEFWRAVLGRLPGVRAIRLSSGNLPDLASVLAHDHGQGGHADWVLAPALEVLDLHRMRLLMRPPANLKVPLADGQIGDLASLCKAIATRRGSAGRLVVNRWHGDLYGLSGMPQSEMIGEWRGGRVRVHKVDRPRGLRM